MQPYFHWINEPAEWRRDSDGLTVVTNKHTDFWRHTWYGFERFSGHLYAAEVAGDFTLQAKICADFTTLYDQAGLMMMADEQTWLKAGIEFNDDAPAIGSVLTLTHSDWATGLFPGDPRTFWLRLTRKGDALRLQYSTDGERWPLLRDAIRMQAPFDTVGAILSALLLGSTIMAANSLQNATSQFGSLCWMALAALSGMAFIWQIRRTGSPLLPPSMFKNERFTLAAFTSMVAFVSQGITFIALPFLFQSEYGYSPVVSALLFTPWPLGIVLIAPHAGRWADTISAPAISTLGLVIFVVGLILLATLPARPSMWDICLRSLVCGIGFGCFQSPNNREMLSNVIREHASYASGVLSIMRTFGQCLGAAAVAVLLAADERSIHVALWSAAAASAVSVVVSASRLRKITHPAETG